MVASVDLLGTPIIVTISTGITFLTALSITAMTTDQHLRVKGNLLHGQPSLGVKIESAVNILLYLAQGLSVALQRGASWSVINAFSGAAVPERA